MLKRMKVEMQLQAVNYAVQRKIFCECGQVLCSENAVLITRKSGGAAVCCGRCWDKMIANKAREAKLTITGAVLVMQADGIEIDDSRELQKLLRHEEMAG